MNTETTDNFFWLDDPDSIQSAMHLALNWLVYVYPSCANNLESILEQSQTILDTGQNQRWQHFFTEHSIAEHLTALQWLAQAIPQNKVPSLLESSWRLLLISHSMPTQFPLVMRVMARILAIPESQVVVIGEQVQTQEKINPLSEPLTPIDPRYLDRIEWRLYGADHGGRLPVSDTHQEHSHWLKPLLIPFGIGVLVGAGLISFLVWGPMQLARQRIPLISHQLSQPYSPAIAAVPFITTNHAIFSIESTKTIKPQVLINDSALISEAEQTQASPATQLSASIEVDDQTETEIITTEATESDAIPVELEPEPSVEILMVITATTLNVRAQPDLAAEVVMQLSRGAEVWMDPEESDDFWRYIRVGDTHGYASGRFIVPAQ